jgi:hypothetical protein
MPGPKPTHQPRFTEEQLLLSARVAARHSAPHREVWRARLTLLLSQEPQIDSVEAGRRLGIDPDTVYKWRRRWASGEWSLKDRPRPGRPRIFSP